MIAILRTELQEAGPTPLWNAVNVGITALLHQDGRRVVLVFTDGVDRPDGNNNVSFREVARNAAREDVMVYAIGLAGRLGYGGRRRGSGGVGGGIGTGRGGPGQPVEMSKPDPGLPKIATETGGGYFELTSANNMSATFVRIADELHRQYALAFTPAKFDGKTHRIEVRVRRPRSDGARPEVVRREGGRSRIHRAKVRPAADIKRFETSRGKQRPPPRDPAKARRQWREPSR